ncbi:uncharacterized protein LOC119900205 isoform X2 [Micropterus salmoides]|uniref:uncharacterized protein LOC119900205 isoform X2 n=1 Tax=Micropterus salmoides TaxID=27706 RepID=UPI0018EC40F8|nr:uncharacterized protein LOC119900205 isoform X2 [Micropterus salmoides]
MKNRGRGGQTLPRGSPGPPSGAGPRGRARLVAGFATEPGRAQPKTATWHPPLHPLDPPSIGRSTGCKHDNQRHVGRRPQGDHMVQGWTKVRKLNGPGPWKELKTDIGCNHYRFCPYDGQIKAGYSSVLAERPSAPNRKILLFPVCKNSQTDNRPRLQDAEVRMRRQETSWQREDALTDRRLLQEPGDQLRLSEELQSLDLQQRPQWHK